MIEAAVATSPAHGGRAFGCLTADRPMTESLPRR